MSLNIPNTPSYYSYSNNTFNIGPPLITPPSIEEYEIQIREKNAKLMTLSSTPYRNIITTQQNKSNQKIRIGSIIDVDIVEGREKFSIPKEWLQFLEHYKTSVAFISSDEFSKIGVNDNNIESILRLMRLWDESRYNMKPEEEAQWVYKALDASSEYSPEWSPSNTIGCSNTYPKHGTVLFDSN